MFFVKKELVLIIGLDEEEKKWLWGFCKICLGLDGCYLIDIVIWMIVFLIWSLRWGFIGLDIIIFISWIKSWYLLFE